MSLVIAMVLDAIFGEPRWLWSRAPHPAVLMGRTIGWADQRFNKAGNRKTKGTLLMMALVLAAFSLGSLLSALPGNVIDILVLAVLLAQRSLADHVTAVAKGLEQNLTLGRQAVAQIVGRDTANMHHSDVARSAIESGAENLSDGVIAPIFWFVVGGLPGLLVYKVTNTADSMIGYRTLRYRDFGWAAARLDDVLNLIPARLTAILMASSSFKLQELNAIAADAPMHRSPNAGWPEAAMAHICDIALSGPRSYDGEMKLYPFVNEDGERDLGAKHIRQAVSVLWRTWALVLILAALAAWVLV